MHSQIRHRDNTVKCRFFVVPSDGIALLGMPGIDIEVL